MKDQSQSLSIRTKRFSGQRRPSVAELAWDAARLIAADALRELQGEAVQKRLRKKANGQ